MTPLAQSLGIVSLYQMVSNKSVRTVVAVLRSAFSMNGVYALGFTILHSVDDVFDFHSMLINESGTGGGLAGSSGWGWLRT